uniref:Zinc finger GRF-type domain-containing protein n=1 Tax=Triticum urartu TaxID=4572 RepID=A0A8R7R2H8_TRIUA
MGSYFISYFPNKDGNGPTSGNGAGCRADISTHLHRWPPPLARSPISCPSPSSALLRLTQTAPAMESSSSSIRRRTTPPALLLIPCPFCRDRIITNICGPRGSQPGNRYYKCCKKDSGKCPFYEWQEGYEAYLVEQSAADGAAHNQEIFQALPRTVAQRGSFLGARQLQDLLGSTPCWASPICWPLCCSSPSHLLYSSRCTLLVSHSSCIGSSVTVSVIWYRMSSCLGYYEECLWE